MKIIKMMLVGIALSSTVAQAETFVSDSLSYKSLVKNFDGSITITAPRLMTKGRPLLVVDNFDSALGICAILQKKLVNYSHTSPSYSGDLLVSVSPFGEFDGTTRPVWTVLSDVTCR